MDDAMPPPLASIGYECLTCHEFVYAGAAHRCWQGKTAEPLGCCPLCGRAEPG